MKYITSFYYKGHGYSIIHDTTDGEALSYRAIDKRFIDANGNLTKTINCIEMSASATLKDCLDCVKLYIDFDELTAQGYDLDTAVKMLISEKRGA